MAAGMRGSGRVRAVRARRGDCRVASRIIAAALLLIALAVTSTPAEAQRRARGARVGPTPPPAVGMRGGYDFELEAWSIGAQASIPFARRLAFLPSGDAFFGEDRTDWQLNADLAIRLGRAGFLYTGGGLALLNRVYEEAGDADAETRTGANAFVGLQTPGRRLPFRPFVEARWTFVDGESPFRLAFGANVALGGRAHPLPRRR